MAFTDLLMGAMGGGGLGGMTGGLGGSGGTGGSIPSNSSAANSAATATIQPSVTLGARGDTIFTLGPFAPVFPGAGVTPSDAINAPTPFGLNSTTLAVGGGVAVLLLVMLLAFKR